MALNFMQSPEVGEFLGGAYEFLEELGSGGFATVFQGKQLSTGQLVAVKVQKLPDQTGEEGGVRRARFERETKLCATLSHPHIVRLLDRGQSEQFAFLVFEYVPGKTLRDTLTQHGALEPSEAVLLMGQVLDALDAAHAKGIVHRDLKPENLMIVPSGTHRHVKVLDFGAGAFVQGVADDGLSLTRSHEIVGTPSYASPEQLRGEPATSKSDVYAWALVLLECLTGERVMDGATLAEVFHKQLSPFEVPLPPAIAVHPIGDILRRALRKSPSERAGDARRLWSDLQSVRMNALVGPLASGIAARPARTEVVRAPPRLGEQRQATVICCSLSAHGLSDVASDAENLDAVEKDQLSLCADVIARFGGYVAGSIANRIIGVFGVPYATDNDVRRAGRAAIELRSRIETRRSVLSSQRGVDIELRIGLHTGVVVIGTDGSPSGPALNAAARLEAIAGPGVTLVSEVTQTLLRKHLSLLPVARAPSLGKEVQGQPYELPMEQPNDASRLAPGGVVPLIGREPELEALLNHWRSVQAGRGRVVLITGDPGIGKSRLAQELVKHAQQDGADVLECRCLPEDRHTALHALAPLLRRICHVDGVDGVGDIARLENALSKCGVNPADLVGIFGAWSLIDVVPDHRPMQLSPQKQKALLLDAVSKLLCTSRAGAPRLVLVEDVQWADPTTRELLDLASSIANAHSILILLTARPEVATLPHSVAHVTLRGLERDDAARLVSEMTQDLAFDERTLDELVRRADGVPLFLEELARSVNDLASANGSGGRRGLADIPMTLRDLLVERLDRLGGAKPTAQLAAAIGREFSVDLLSVISNEGAEQLESRLGALLAARVVSYKSAQPSLTYEFCHALIHETAAASMLSSDRRAVHRTIAGALESAPGAGERASLALLAWHYELADLPEKAIGSRFAAGMRAAEISAYPEAFEHFGRARDLLEQVSDVDARLSSELDLHNALGGLLIATRGLASDEVVTTYRKAEQLLRAGKPSPAQSAMTLKGLWTFHNARAEYEAAARVGAELLELAGVLGTPEAMLLAYDCAGQTALLTGQFEDAVAYAARAERWLEPSLQRTLAARHGMDPGLALQSFACIADVQLGNLTRAQQRMNRILHSADALGFPGLQAAMHCQNAVLHFFIGSCGARPNELLDRCHRGAERALSIAQQFGFPFWEVLAGMVKIMAGALDGDATILAAGERAIAGWALSGARAACSWHSASLAVGQLAHGAFAAAMQNAEAALAHCTETGEGYGRSEAYRVLGLVLSDTDNPEVDVERAADCFEHALDTAHRQNAHWLELRGAHSFFKSLGSNDRARTDGALSAALEWFETRGEALETPLVADARRQLRRTR